MRTILLLAVRSALAAVLVLGLTFAIAAAPSSAARPDPYGPRYDSVATYSTSIVGDPADVYYPPGALTGETELPVAFLMQGALVDKGLYSTYAKQVAAYGFAVVVTNNFNVVFGQTGYYQQELSLNEVQVWMNAENINSQSALVGRIDTDSLMMLGHSYGGAATLFAIGNICQIPFCYGVYERPTNLKGAALWGANTVTPDAQQIPGVTQPVTPIDAAGVPIALINGTNDGAATPINAQRTFDVITGASRALVSLSGANHYGVTDVQNPAGAKPDPNAQTLSQQVSIDEISRWSAMWLLAQLGDPAARHFVYDGAGDKQDRLVTVQLAS